MNKYSLLASALVIAMGLTAPAVHAQSANQQSAAGAAGNETSRDTGQPGAADVAAQPDRNPASTNAASSMAISDEDFIEEASAKGVAEIETGKMALERGTDTVKEFAQQMIDDHGKTNEKMKSLAQKHDLDISDGATLLDKARAMTLRVRDGESFDKAYANNQVSAHEQTIELFQRAKNSDNAEISAFAGETLPKLEEHLSMARELAAKTDAADD